jgi:hypothetical protein
MGSEISKPQTDEDIKIIEKEKIQKYQPPKLIPFPHKNETRWIETVEFLSHDMTSFEELRAIFKSLNFRISFQNV